MSIRNDINKSFLPERREAQKPQNYPEWIDRMQNRRHRERAKQEFRSARDGFEGAVPMPDEQEPGGNLITRARDQGRRRYKNDPTYTEDELDQRDYR